MSRPASAPLRKPLGLYAVGHVTLLAGAWAMGVTGSMWPMAFAASACLMLTVPVIRHVVARAAARRRQGRTGRV
jgi:multisubunit Na+/H+ antiporter MnhG subunit